MSPFLDDDDDDDPKKARPSRFPRKTDGDPPEGRDHHRQVIVRG